MRYTAAAIVLSAALSVSAASHNLQARQGIPSCATTCLLSGNLGSCSLTDYTCLCNSQSFISSTTSCIESTCQGADLAAAVSAAQSLCAAVGVTLPPVNLPGAPGPSPSTSSTPPPPPPSQPSSTPAPSPSPTSSDWTPPQSSPDNNDTGAPAPTDTDAPTDTGAPASTPAPVTTTANSTSTATFTSANSTTTAPPTSTVASHTTTAPATTTSKKAGASINAVNAFAAGIVGLAVGVLAL